MLETERQLNEYFAGSRDCFELELDFVGTEFQRKVWQALLTIPFGETRSYSQIAAQVGSPKAVRAVGAANGRNPISIIAPCHRVIGASGSLTGFAGGLQAKQFLLALEEKPCSWRSDGNGCRPGPRAAVIVCIEGQSSGCKLCENGPSFFQEHPMEAAKPALIRETFPVGPLQCNCTIIGDPVTKKAIVVDPGGNPDLIMARLDALGLKVVSIIHTHAHLDHFLASGQMKEKTGATLHLHKEDQFLWDNLEMQCSMFGVPYTPVPAPDRWLADDEELACGCGVALHTPGHTPGSMSFWFAEAKLLIAGDTLFKRGVGRTDLWGRSGHHRAFDQAASVHPR